MSKCERYHKTDWLEFLRRQEAIKKYLRIKKKGTDIGLTSGDLTGTP